MALHDCVSIRVNWEQVNWEQVNWEQVNWEHVVYV